MVKVKHSFHGVKRRVSWGEGAKVSETVLWEWVGYHIMSNIYLNSELRDYKGLNNCYILL